MAGDIGVDEKVIVVSRDDRDTARAMVASAAQEGPRLIHRYGPRVLIAEASDEVIESSRRVLGDAEVTAAPRELTSSATEGLDLTGALGLAAFSLRQSPEYVAAKEQRPHAGAAWDAGGDLMPPDPGEEHQHLTGAPSGARNARAAVGSTSERMTGSIAVGIIIVSGPTADLQFSDSEEQKVVAEVQNGLGWLASQNQRAEITWHYDIHSVSVDAVPGSSSDKEALWRNPAMVKLGLLGRLAGRLGLHRRHPHPAEHPVDLRRLLHQVPAQPLRLRQHRRAAPGDAVRERRLGARQHRSRVRARVRPHLPGAGRVLLEQLQLRWLVGHLRPAQRQLPAVRAGRWRRLHHALEQLGHVPLDALPLRVPGAGRLGAEHPVRHGVGPGGGDGRRRSLRGGPPRLGRQQQALLPRGHRRLQRPDDRLGIEHPV